MASHIFLVSLYPSKIPKANYRPQSKITRLKPSNSLLSSYQSLTEDLTQSAGLQIKRKEKMKKVLSMLCKMDDPFESMITVDILQRLSIDHHFDEEIMNIVNSLQHISLGGYKGSGFCDLRYVALRFRLLRQHGHYVSSGEEMRSSEGFIPSTIN